MCFGGGLDVFLAFSMIFYRERNVLYMYTLNRSYSQTQVYLVVILHWPAAPSVLLLSTAVSPSPVSFSLLALLDAHPPSIYTVFCTSSYTTCTYM